MKTLFIIVTFNNEKTIERCLHHIYSQEGAFRVVVWDNASSDGTVDIVRRQFPQVECMESDENIGFAAGNNRAAEKAEAGELIALVNPDAFLLPGWLMAMHDAAQRYADAGSFAALQWNGDRTVIDGAGDCYHISGQAWRRLSWKQAGAVDVTQERSVFSPCAAAALYRREAWHEAGGLDEDYFCYFEDVDLGYRLQLLGYDCVFIPNAQAVHLGFSSSAQFSDFAIYHGNRNLVTTFYKCMPWPLLILALPLHLLAGLLTLVGFIGIGRGSSFIRGRWHGLMRLPVALRKRKEVQSARKVSWWRIARRLTWHSYTARLFSAFLRTIQKKWKTSP